MDGRVIATAPLQRQAWRDATMPPVESLGNGLWSIPVPIPNNPLRYVLVYAFERPDGVTLVDAGWNTEIAWTALCDGLAVAGFAMTDVRSVLVTHIHPDHYGLAGRVREVSGAAIALHPADAALIPGRYGAGMDDVIAAMRHLMMRNGVPSETINELSDASVGMRDFVDAVSPDMLIEDGDRVDVPGHDLRVIHTPGHSPGHVCFHDVASRRLLSGDHVLPRISPSVTMHTQQITNPLADFLESLLRVRGLEVDEVLPAHQWRFKPLLARVDDLLAHHERRLTETMTLVTSNPGATCWEIAQQLRWSRPWPEISPFMRRAAVGETLAHLLLLEARQAVQPTAGAVVGWRPCG